MQDHRTYIKFCVKKEIKCCDMENMLQNAFYERTTTKGCFVTTEDKTKFAIQAPGSTHSAFQKCFADWNIHWHKYVLSDWYYFKRNNINIE